MKREVFDELKKIFRTKKQKEEDEERLKEFHKSEEAMIKQLEDIDKDFIENNEKPIDYEKYFDNTLGLEKKKRKDVSLNHIRDIAEKNAKYDYDKGIGAVDKRYDLAKLKEQKNISDAENNASDELVDIRKKFDKVKKAEHSKSIDKGVLKSSIAKLIDDEISNAEKSASKAVLDKASRKISEALDETERLKKERDRAIATLDLKKANDIINSIEKQESELKKLNDDIDSYNNSVDEREREYAIKRKRAIRTLAHEDDLHKRSNHFYENHNGYRGQKKQDYEKRAIIAYNLYSQLPREQALDAMKSNYRLRQLLGNLYEDVYYRIYNGI